jgi:hypothetical protein
MTDPKTLPGHFAANVDRAAIAEFIDAYKAVVVEKGTVAYDSMPPLPTIASFVNPCTVQHSEGKRCLLVIRAERREEPTVVERAGTRVPAHNEAPRIPVKRNDGTVVGDDGRQQDGAADRLRKMRAGHSVGRELRVWPVQGAV